jgi:hypothetical protein
MCIEHKGWDDEPGQGNIPVDHEMRIPHEPRAEFENLVGAFQRLANKPILPAETRFPSFLRSSILPPNDHEGADTLARNSDKLERRR